MFEIYRERFADASNQTFFFVGNVEDKDIDLIAKYLNNLPVNGKQKNDKFINRNPQFTTGIQHAEAVKGIERQGMLIMSGQVNVDAKELDPQTRIAITELGEALSITVTEIIREKNGDAYSPSANISFSPSITGNGTVAWQFYIGCDPEKAKKIEKDCINIMKQYMKKGCDEKTLGKVQEQMCVQHAKSVQNNGFWLGQIQGSYMDNEDRDYHVKDYDNLVKSITTADIKAVAAKYINLNNYVVVKLRPEDGAVGTAD
jgi:zinc protease